jgi:hypothetical protein
MLYKHPTKRVGLVQSGLSDGGAVVQKLLVNPFISGFTDKSK